MKLTIWIYLERLSDGLRIIAQTYSNLFILYPFGGHEDNPDSENEPMGLAAG